LFVLHEESFPTRRKIYFQNLFQAGESFRLECWRQNYISGGVKRPKKPNRTEQEKLDAFLNDLRLKRLKKNLSEQQLRKACVPSISPRAWWQWHRVLKPGEQREFPNQSHKKRLHEALTKLPKRPKKLVGRPSKAFKKEAEAIAAKAVKADA
jgi:FMN-dependent NADH-azoreductase